MMIVANDIKIIKSDKPCCMTKEQFVEYYLSHNYNGNMFNSNHTFNHNYNNHKNTGLIAKIFEEHWDIYYSLNKDKIDNYRPNANKEIRKVIDCYNKDLGGSAYICPHCDELFFISHTCKSRFCSSCGYKYKLERVENILQTVYECKHRQIVFTIPKELRPYFFFPFEERLDILFEAVNKTLYSLINDSFKISKKNKSKKKYSSKIKYTPGFICFLHTFGRSLIWNPHIHVLFAEIKLGDDNSIKKITYLNYDALSMRFQKILLDLLYEQLGPSFKPLKSKLFNIYKKGFYVYAEPKKFKNIKNGIEYVARYCGRVPISENRIIKYNDNNVTYSYIDHKDNQYHEVTLSVFDFIEILLRHLIPENYKIIRYYGFYRKKHKSHDKIKLLVVTEKRKFRKQLLKHQLLILNFFKRDPYCCPICNSNLEYAFEVT